MHVLTAFGPVPILPAVSKLRLGIIGAGRHGSRYAKHTAEDVEQIELVAVSRRSREEGRAVADRYGCDYSADPMDLVRRSDIDALAFVTVPTALEPLVSAAADAGKHLLVEKPVAANLASGRRILARIEASGVYCMAGHTLRFNRVVNRLRELTSSLGRIDSLVFSQRFPPQLDREWLDDPAISGGGNILHTGVHCFDLIRYITGLDPGTVSCVSGRVYTRRTEDHFIASFTLRDSTALAAVACSRATSGRNGLIEISGEQGLLVGDHVLGTLYRIGEDGHQDIDAGKPVHTVLAALRRFASDIDDGTPSPATYRDGLVAVATAEACYAAARSGCREPVVLP